MVPINFHILMVEAWKKIIDLKKLYNIADLKIKSEIFILSIIILLNIYIKNNNKLC